MKTTDISLKNFLKTYTAIREEFIDEYYEFYEMCEKNIYGIHLDKVIEYLEIVKKEKFYKRFRDNYIINEDYIIVKNNGKAKRGEKLVNYFIKLDVFEKICMMSKSKKANSVRDYFIILRKLIYYYKNNIHKMIIKNVLDGSNKCIYIIMVNKNKNIFKIGKTEKNFRERMRQYVTGSDLHPDIKFILLVDDPKHVEDCVKTILSKNHYRGTQEIYKISLHNLKNVIFKCADTIDSIKNIDKENIDCYVMFDDTPDNIQETPNVVLIKKNVTKKRSHDKPTKKNSNRKK